VPANEAPARTERAQQSGLTPKESSERTFVVTVKLEGFIHIVD
jgi:hypothetical protein